MVFSRRRDNSSSAWVGRETSKAGEAMGLSSVVMVKRPSKGLSGRGGGYLCGDLGVDSGLDISKAYFHLMERRLGGGANLVFPSRISATPYSSPNASSRARN